MYRVSFIFQNFKERIKKVIKKVTFILFRWGQTYILESLISYVPQEMGDAEMLCERIAPRLQHANSSVVLTAVKVIIYLMNYMTKEEDINIMCRKLSPPLVTLLSSGPEV